MEKIKLTIKKFFSKDREIKILLIVITLFLVWNIRNIIFTTKDDFELFLIYKSNYTAKMIDSAAKNQGRYQFYFNFRVSFIPYIFNNFIIYKIISAGFVILTFISSFILIKRINLNLAYLFLLLLLVLYPSTLEHNLIMSYPVFLQIPWLCLMLALEFFLQSLENKNYTKLKLLISAFLLYIAILPYEQFIIYFVLFFLLSYFYKKPIFSVLKYHIIAILIHLVTYISFRFLFPSNYTGNEISLHGNNFINALKVIWTYSTAYFPLKIFYYNFFEDKAFFLNFDNLSSSTYFYILIGLFSSFQVINILNNLKNINHSKYYVYLSLFFIFIPTIPFAITKKYQDWVLLYNSHSYTVSYYSYFPIILLLSFSLLYFYKLNFINLSFRKIIVILSITISVVFTGINNEYIYKIYTKSSVEKRFFLDVLNSNKEIQKIKNDSIIYIPEFKNFASPELLSDYISNKLNKNIEVVTEKNKLNFNKHVYYFNFYALDNYDIGIIIGEIDSKFVSTNISIISKNQDDKSLIIQNWSNKDKIIHIGSDKYIGSLNVNSNIENVEVVLGNLEVPTPLNIAIKDKNYGIEGKDTLKWIWLDANDTLLIENTENMPIKIRLITNIKTGYEAVSDIDIYYDGKLQDRLKTNVFGNIFTKEIIISPKSIKNITFISKNIKKILAKDDPRDLYLKLENFKIEILN